jgi:vacuolar iron transporter family protein
MNIGSTLQRLRSSFKNSAGTIVFGMEDGTVSIFGLIFGVAATTTDTKTVLIAGATGAVAAAVSMMAGVYLDAETTRDETAALRTSYTAADSVRSLSNRLAKAGLTSEQSNAVAVAVQNDPAATIRLLRALQGAPGMPLNPLEQALWMLLADFLAAAVPILLAGKDNFRGTHGSPARHSRCRPSANRKTQRSSHRARDRFNRDRRCSRRGRNRCAYRPFLLRLAGRGLSDSPMLVVPRC